MESKTLAQIIEEFKGINHDLAKGIPVIYLCADYRLEETSRSTSFLGIGCLESFAEDLGVDQVEYLQDLVERELNSKGLSCHVNIDALIEGGYTVNIGIDLTLADLDKYSPEMIERLLKINLVDFQINTGLPIPNDVIILGMTYVPAKDGFYVHSDDYL